MSKLRQQRGTAALVVAIVALVAAIGGVAAAAPGPKAHAASKRGPRGHRGPSGFTGPRGPSGFSHIDFVTGPESFVCGDGSCSSADSAIAFCPAGETAVGGGFIEDANLVFISTTALSAPVSGGSGWGVVLGDIGSSDGGFSAVVQCAAGGGAATDMRSSRSAQTPSAVKKIAAGLSALHN
jgi:hypothetical protein